MRYCPQCGYQVKETAAFCENCGNRLIQESNSNNNSQPNKENQREGSPSGNNTCRCKSCGEIIEAMRTSCPWCGQEITDKEILASMKDFNSKLMKLENETFVPYESEFRKIFGHDSSDLTEEEAFERKKRQRIASFIANYPIPTSSEDICEFFLLADSHVSSPDGRATIDAAWRKKYEQIYNKARFSLDEARLRRIESIYNQRNDENRKASEKRKKRIKTGIIAGVASTLAFVLFIIISVSISTSRTRKENEEYNNKINEIESALLIKDYEKAEMLINSLNDDSYDRKKQKRELTNRLLGAQGKLEGMSMIPEYSSDSLYQDVESMFKSAGFENVTSEQATSSTGLEKYMDQFSDWMSGTKEGAVVEVSINGSTAFEKGTYVSKDSAVVIRYFHDTKVADDLKESLDGAKEVISGVGGVVNDVREIADDIRAIIHGTVDLTNGLESGSILLTLKLKCIENIALNKDDIDVKIDGKYVCTIEHGTDMVVPVKITPGAHTIVFSKAGENQGSSQSINVPSDTTLSFTVKIKFSGIDVKAK